MTLRFRLLLCLHLSVTQAADIAPQDLNGQEAQNALAQYEVRISQNQQDIAALKAAGIILHQLNRAQADPLLVAKAETYLKKAVVLQGEDQETVAWLGSVTTMKAIFESDPGKQSFFVKLGCRMMDKAVKKVPDNIVVRLTRANNSLELPAFLMRTHYAIEDFQYYLKLCESQVCPQHYINDAAIKLSAAKQILAENF